MDNKPVRVRFAPSPTGDLHIGGARTALINWLFARHYNGTFILRIEDTDQSRTIPNSAQRIMDDLRWLGLEWDEGVGVGGDYGPYVQSQRLGVYHEYAEHLLATGHAYRDDGAIRFLVPSKRRTTTFGDMLRGTITVQNNTLQDAVLLKSDGYPTYHLASVVDDHLMAISHIIRGDEWLSSAPLHKLLYDAFGWEMPHMAHVSVMLKQVGEGKISKRDSGSSVAEYREGGYLPEALVNYLCNTTWHNSGVPDNADKETQIFTKEAAARNFSMMLVPTSAARFDAAKLLWMNGEYIRRMSVDELASKLRTVLHRAGLTVDEDRLPRVTGLIQPRLKTLNDVVDKAGFFFKDSVEVTAQDLTVDVTNLQARRVLRVVHGTLFFIENFNTVELESAIQHLPTVMKLTPQQFYGVIRTAVSGQAATPPIYDTLAVLGKEVVLKRLEHAFELLRTEK